MLAEKLDRLGAATSEAAVHIHVAVLGYLGEPVGQLGERYEHRTGDAHLLAFPRFAHVDQHSTIVTQRGVHVFRARVDLDWHRASIRSSSDQPC